jgi:hypothetical protein
MSEEPQTTSPWLWHKHIAIGNLENWTPRSIRDSWRSFTEAFDLWMAYEGDIRDSHPNLERQARLQDSNPIGCK